MMSSMTPPNRDLVIATPRLTLRATRLSDVPRFTEIESNWNVAKMLRTAPWPVIEANMAAWVATHPQEWVGGTAYRFTILRGELVIGMCDIGGIADQCGGFGYWLDEAFWGHGYAKEAATAVLALARDHPGLRATRGMIYG